MQESSVSDLTADTLYHAIVRNLPHSAILVFDRDLRYLLVQGSELEAIAFSRVALVGYTIWQVLPSDICEIIEPIYRAALAGSTTKFEILLLDQINRLCCSPLINQQGEIFAGLVLVQDVSGRAIARISSERQECEWRSLVEHSPDIIARFNQHYHHVYINLAIEKLTGKPARSFFGKTYRELGMPEAFVHQWQQGIQRVFETAQHDSFEFDFSTPTGKRSYHSYLVPEYATDGTIEFVLAITRDMTQRKQLEAQMQQRQHFFEKITDLNPNIIYVYDLIEQRNVYINLAIGEILGYSPETIQKMGMLLFPMLLHPDDIDHVNDNLRRCMTLEDDEVVEIEYRMRDVTGQWQWLVSRETVFSRTSDGRPKQILGTAQKITERKQVEATLRLQAERERLLSAIAQRIRQSLNLDGILNTTVAEVRHFLQTDRVIIYRLNLDGSGTVVVESVESPWMPLLGMLLVDCEFANDYVSLYQQGRIQAVEDIYNAGLSECHTDWLAQFQVRANLVVPILQGEELWGLLVAQHCRTTRHWHPSEIQLLKQLATQVGIAIQQAELYQELEISNRELQHLASLDALTQLANRRQFDEYLDQQWQQLAKEEAFLSLVFCDVDFFKKYNDTYGHQAGDDCLQKIARAMKYAVKRSTDLVTRYGGEEFAVILPNTEARGAVQVAGEIRSRIRSLRLAHATSEVSQHVTLSLGVASTVPQDSTSPQQLIEAADKALYQAKAQGRDRIVLQELN